MKPINLIILAAGNSTRLKSRVNKVMHPIAGRPMIDYVLTAARALRPRKIALVVGYGREALQEHLRGQRDLVFAVQKTRLGTAHAARIGLEALKISGGEVIILNGDVPLLDSRTLKKLIKVEPSNPLALLTAVLPNPTGYGRILRDAVGVLRGIVEEKNADAAQREINEINAGVYRAQVGFLKGALRKIKKDSVKGEYYLTEIVSRAVQEGFFPESLTVQDPHEILGANTRAELAFLNQMVASALNARHLEEGVGMQDPDTVFIDYGVKIGADSFLASGVQLMGKTRLGKGVTLEAGCILKNCQVADGVTLKAYSYLESCRLSTGAVVGPFARIRPGSQVGEGAQVGNFVELKKTKLGRESKANHLSYLGDSVIGKKVNIGAGTITCNYDGKKKFVTKIADGAFIGSDTQLVAPVKVGKGAYVGAGTTVTRNVPPGALATSRVEQKNLKKGKA